MTSKMADSNTLVSKFEDFFKKLKASNETSTLNDLFNIVGQLPEEKKLVSLNNILRHKETSFSKIIFKNEDKTKVFDAKKYFNELLAKAFKTNNLNSARLLITIEFLTGYLKKYCGKFNDFDKEYLEQVFRLNDNIFTNNDLPPEFNNYKNFFQKERKNLFLEVIKKGNADMISIFVLLESCNDSFDEDGFNFLHLLLRNEDPKPLKCILDLVESAKMDVKNSKKLENGLLIGSKELTKLNEVFESCFKAKRKINPRNDLNQKTFEISFEKPENFWLLFTTKYKQIEQIFEDYKEKNLEIRKKDVTLFLYCIMRDYCDILILLLDKLIKDFSKNLTPVYAYIDSLIKKKINSNYFLYYVFYFDKITSSTTQDSKLYKFISKLIEFSKLKEQNKECLFNELFFSYNSEQVTCFDLILRNENRQLLNFVFPKYEPFSDRFLNFSNKQKNNCLHLSAIYECYDLFDFLFGEFLKKKCTNQIVKANHENKSPFDIIMLNKNFDLSFNLVKKVDNLKINIQPETFIFMFKELNDNGKVNTLIQKINLTDFNFYLLMNKLIIGRDEKSALKLVNFVQDFTIQANEQQTLDIVRNLLKLKWNNIVEIMFKNSAFLRDKKIYFYELMIKEDNFSEELAVAYFNLIIKSYSGAYDLLIKISAKKWNNLFEISIDTEIENLNKANQFDEFIEKHKTNIIDFLNSIISLFNTKVLNKDKFQVKINDSSLSYLIELNEQDLVKKMLEFNKNDFKSYENFLLKSIDVNNERIAEILLDYVKFKSKSKFIEWKCCKITLIPDLINKNWWSCVHKLLDLIDLDYASISNQTKSAQNKPRQTSINSKISSGEEEECLCLQTNGIFFRLENDNSENRHTFFYLDSNDNKKRLTTKHPLIRIAESKNADLINHKTVSNLLKLKWRWLPRLIYYSFTLFYILFLSFFINHASFYSITIADNNSTNASINSTITTVLEMKIQNIPWLLWILIGIFFLMEIGQILDHMKLNKLGVFKYIADLKNILELLTCVLSLIALLLESTSCASLTIISGSLVMILRLEKMRLIGKYSVAFRRTILNSAILLPVFIILLVAFLFSFRVRSSFDVNHFNGTFSNSFLKTLSMVVGDYETSEMGVEDGGEYIYFNIFIYSLFIIVMSILFNNLFVAIAVGELADVLKEAKIYHICLRIQYVIRTEEILYTIMPFKDTLVHFFPINYAFFEPENEYRIVRFYKKVLERFKSSFEVNHVKSKQTGFDDLKEIILNLESKIGRMEMNLDNLSRNLEIKTKNLEKSILNLNEEINSLKKEALAKI